MSNVIEFIVKGKDELSGVLSETTAGFSKLKKALAGTAIAAIAYATVNLAKKSLDEADAMGALALKVGMSVKTLSALSFAASQSNVETATLTNGLKFLSKAASEGSTTSAGRALATLGVNARNADGSIRPLGDIMLDLSNKFAGAKDNADKAALAMEIMGRSGVDMIPLLNRGSDSIVEMMNKAEALGLVITEELANSADSLNDTLNILERTMQGSMNVAMAKFAPVLDQLIGQFIDWNAEADGVARAGDVIANGMRVIASVTTIVIGVVKTLGDHIGGVIAMLVSMINGEFSQAWTIAKNTVTDVGANIAGTVTQVGKIWDESAQKTSEATTRQLKSLISVSAAEEKHKQALAAEKTALDNWKKSMDEASDIIKSQYTPLDKHISRLQAIEDHRAALIAQGADVDALLQKENEAWIRSSASVEQYRQSTADTATILGAMLSQHVANVSSFAYESADLIMNSFETVSKGIGDAVGDAIVSGASLAGALEAVAKSVLKTVISTLVQIGVQRLILSAIDRSATMAQASSQLAAGASQVYMNSFASAAAMPMYGWAVAPGIAAGNAALALAGAATSGASGGALGLALGGGAHGGLDYVPDESTFLLQKGERVLSPRQNADLTTFMEKGGSSGVVIQNLVIHVLENATNADVFAHMDKIQLRNALGYPIIDALNEMSRIGVKPDFMTEAYNG